MASRFSLEKLTTVTYTSLALIAFAANSVLCRLALERQVDGYAIDPGSFTIVRLSSGIGALVIILYVQTYFFQRPANISLQTHQTAKKSKGSWLASVCLFLYAFGFSYAYVSLETGTGALILFGVVQITMISVTFVSGNKLCVSEWVGVLIALLGFLWLILPGVSAPSLEGLILMAISGIAWAVYTLMGKKSEDPLADTHYNFLRTLPFILILVIYNIGDYYLTQRGLLLAVASGAITSGLGYSIWYLALKRLATIQAAVLQLLVPVLAATAGVLFVSEVLTERLIGSSLLILGGIFLVVAGKKIMLNLVGEN
jgi:drug/metabolite transporter (DMT)-like permease